jgi:hypothetical protein
MSAALAELSDLLGVRISEVYRDQNPELRPEWEWSGVRWVRVPTKDVFGAVARRGWTLEHTGFRLRLRSSDDVREPSRLNQVARSMGRDHRLPPLTAADGRRALRLMHESVEERQGRS